MAIYDINGNQLQAVYDIEGNSLQYAYDIEGNQIFGGSEPPVGTPLKVMTYNIQKCIGINSQQAMQNLIINTYDADLIGIQETGGTTMPSVMRNALTNYQYTYIGNATNATNPTSIVSKSIQFSNATTVLYENQDPQDWDNWHERRIYVKAEITIGGKNITWINTHLSFLTKSVMFAQMAELFDVAEQCDYAIITGDFNSAVVTEESDYYINMYKPFVDAGYHLANNSPAAGFTNTYTNQSNATSLADLQTAPDSIIVSGNIDIDSVVFDTTKFSYLNGSVIDHIPVIATLTIH